MPSEDDELLSLQDAERVAWDRFRRLDRLLTDTEDLRHARGIWKEAHAALSKYQSREAASLRSARDASAFLDE
jgi:hypothetical protein